jgi:hypothetical protein
MGRHVLKNAFFEDFNLVFNLKVEMSWPKRLKKYIKIYNVLLKNSLAFQLYWNYNFKKLYVNISSSTHCMFYNTKIIQCLVFYSRFTDIYLMITLREILDRLT